MVDTYTNVHVQTLWNTSTPCLSNSLLDLHVYMYRLKQAKLVLQCRLHHLKSLTATLAAEDNNEDLASVHISVATCYKRLAVGTENSTIYISSALKHCMLALELEPECKESLWLSKLLKRQQDVEAKKKVASEGLNEATPTARRMNLTMPKPVEVSKYHA